MKEMSNLSGAQRNEAHPALVRQRGSQAGVSGPRLGPRAGGSRALDQEPSWLLTPAKE